MADFTPITSQEQFDSMVKDRLERAAKKYEGYISPAEFETKTSELNKQLADTKTALDAAVKKSNGYEKDIADRDAKIKGYETAALKTRIAHEVGLSYDAIGFLQGDSEEGIKASADALKKLTSASGTVPDFSLEPPTSKGSDAAYKEMLKNMNI